MWCEAKVQAESKFWFILFLASLLSTPSCEKTQPKTEQTSSQGGGGATKSASATVAGTLSLESVPPEVKGNNQVNLANQEVNVLNDGGAVVAKAYTGNDGSFVASIPGSLAVPASSGLRLEGGSLKLQSVISKTADGSVIGTQVPLDFSKSSDLNIGKTDLKKITAIKGNASLDGARDHVGIVVYIPGTSYSARTDSSGNFLMTFLSTGTYELRFEKDGYTPITISGVTVLENETTKIPSAILKLSGGAGLFSVKQSGSEGVSQSRDVEFLIAPGNADRFKAGLINDVDALPYAAIPDVFRHHFGSDGIYTFKFMFANADGFESTAIRTIVVDTVKPNSSGLKLADRSSLSATHTNERIVIAYHPTCSDIDKVAITASGDNTPNATDFIWKCQTSASDSNQNFQLPQNASTYGYKIWAMDQVGNISEASVSGEIVFDNIPPSAPQAHLSDQTSGSTSGTDITTINLTMDSCDDLAKILFSESQMVPPQPNQFSLDCVTQANSYTHTFANNIEGKKTLFVWGMDPAGNVGSVSATLNMTLDQTAPTAPSFTLADPTPASSGYSNSLQLNATIASCSDVDKVLISETQTTKPLESDSRWQSCSTSTPATADALGNGNRTLYLWSKDIGGNISATSSNATITVDTTPPNIASATVTLKDLTSLGTIATNSQTIQVSFSPCNDDAHQILITESSSAPAEASFSIACSSGSVTANYTFLSAINETKTVYVWSRDVAGNVSSNNKNATVILDTNPPSIPSSLVLKDLDTNSTSYTNSPTLTVDIDSCGDGQYIFVKEDQSTSPAEGASGWVSCSTSSSVPGIIQNQTAGLKTAHLWIKDEAGNIAGSISGQITWDSDAPSSPSISAPASGAVYTQNATLSVTGTGEANGKLHATGGTAPAVINIDGSGNISGSVSLNTNSRNDLFFEVRDAAGNQSGSVYREVYHDTIAPSISNAQITIRNNAATITWNSSEDSDSVVEWGLSAAYGNTASSAGFTSWGHSVTISGLSENTLYYYKIRSTDQAGNSSVSNDYTNTFRTYISKSGTISSNESWNDTQTSYLITGNVVIANGATVTISPGVTVRFDSQLQIWVEGKLVAQGTAGSKITFRPQIDNASYGYWKSLNFRSNSTPASLDGSDAYVDGNILKHVNILNGGYQEDVINIVDTAVAVFDSYIYKSGESYYGNSSSKAAIGGTKGSSLYLFNTTIEDCAYRAIDLSETGSGSSGVLKVKSSIFKTINKYGIYSGQNGAMTIEDSEFKNFSLGGGVDSFVYNMGHTAASTIRRNLFDGTNAGMHRSLIVDGTLTLEDNIFLNSTVEALSINTGAGPHSIQRNIFYNIDSGIYVGSSIGTINLTGNVFIAGGFRNDTVALFSTSGITTNFTNNLFYGNSGYASAHRIIHAENSSSQVVTMSGNNFINNSGIKAIYNNRTSEKADITATGNYWGSDQLADINSFVYDKLDDPGRGLVNVSSYLTAPNTSAPVSPPLNVSASSSASGSVTLTWSANPESDIAGYRIYWGNDTNYPHDGTGATQGNSGLSVGNVTNYTLTGLPSGSYYFFVTAYDTSADGTRDMTDGNESWYSSYSYVYVSP